MNAIRDRRCKTLVLAAATLWLLGPIALPAQEAPDMNGLERAGGDAARGRAAAAGIDLLAFGNASSLEELMRSGWESQRDDPARWKLERGSTVQLVMPSRRDSVQIGHKVGPVQPAAYPILRMRVRVDSLPAGADLSKKSKEDAAFRFFVVFDKKDGWVAPNTIGYAWASANEPGAFIRSDRSMLKNVWYVVSRSGPEGLGEWVEIERDIEADYRRAFRISGRVPNVVAIGLKADTNDTGAECSAAVAEASLNPR